MGLLTIGNPLSWEETKKLSDHVRKHGIIQFINLYKRLKDRQGDILKWGDEVEYILVKFDEEAKTAKVSLRAVDILNILQEREEANPTGVKSLWRPEYGAYMVEGTPGKPYGGLLAHFNIVEANMKYRREEVEELLLDGEALMSITNFPRLGCEDFSFPIAKPTPDQGATRSLFFPDEVIYPGHPRFKTLSQNIRERRGEKVAINIPVFKDEKTVIPVDDSHLRSKAALPDHIYLDAMGFGMGCCCLQLTFQACNINEARILYDQLTPLSPIMLALTAAAPIFRGFLADIDCRWYIISGSVDDRTPEERGLKPLNNNKFVIGKSRFDSIDSYLSPQGEKYNDVPLTYDKEIYNQLRENDIDHLLAEHVAHLFIRDSVSLFTEKVNQDDEQDTDHFENIQSTNWQTLRFKPPPPNSTIGWRVEFRPCEIQITDFENAAIVCFVVLMTRVILSFKLNFLIPISKVDENMRTAQKKGACLNEKFWFRKDITTQISPPEANECCKGASNGSNCDVFTKMTVNEIINGKNGEFPGLIPLINNYLSGMEVDADTHCTIQRYLKFIQRRASGEILTTASWIRNFVTGHEDYKMDSKVSDRINFDLLKTVKGIQSGMIACPELLGYCPVSKTVEKIPPAMSKVAG
ncbi:PREDICTED: glutamate--cysteine ligase catalytic subunit [Nicrophorus vespilloides]|uniref:Glutamate--cysteine ligase n=1 Tax=Nicrophorus vespilloides TaxID=110193 RepID=A0ABM1M069_NICVS|nr:PREDICTED: glutamate--cysteine ligase catalytic subunit [Nicrophorus vespilloides]